MIKSFTLNNTSDSILSRICLASLIWLLLILGGFSSRAWGDNTATITRRSLSDTDWSNIQNGNTSSAYITWKGNDAGQHVTFRLSGGTFECNSDWKYFRSTGNQTHRISWTVDAGYTISVKEILVASRASTNYSTIKVGPADTKTNPYTGVSGDFGTFSSGVYSPALGNSGSVDIVYTSGNITNNFIKTLTISYTIVGPDETVMFDGTEYWGSTEEKYGPSAFEVDKSHVTFSLKSPMKQYNKYEGFFSRKFKSHEYFYLDKNASSQLKWTVDEGYAINVKSIYFKAKKGKGYVYTSRMAQGDRKTFDQEAGSWVETTFSVDDASNNLFLLDATPTALGNTEYFNIDATTAEVDIEKINITYTISPKTYLVTLDSEGGSDGSEDVTLTFDSNIHDEIINPTKDGCTFDGWYSGDNGKGSLIIAADGTLQENTIYTGAGGVWKKDSTGISLHAKWSGIPYSVRFNGNGNTGGGMSNQAFTYGTAQSLTAIGFTKSCTVTYNANGGSCTTSTTTYFAFEGWATSDSGAKVYDDEEEVENLTSTSGATVDLYAKWATVADTIVLPTPTKDGYVFLGWYNSSNVLVGDAGGPYTPTGSETLEARWVQALTSTVNKSTLLDNFDGDAKSVSWSTEHVTFTLAGDGLKKETWLGTTHFYLYATNSKAWQYDLTWTIDSKDAEGNSAYTISVKKVTFDIERASGLGTYMTIEGRKSGNIYANGNIPSGGISSGTLSKGENETVTTLIETSDIAYSNIVLNNVTVIYTLEPIINVASEQSVPVTICDENTQLLDLSTCASLADQSGHIALNYSLIGDNADNAHKTLDNKFYADVVDTYRVRASVDAAADCHSGKTVEFTINVIPATLELTAPTASEITYPATLVSSTLTGGAAMIGSCEVEGTWAWQNSSTRPSVGDGQSFPVVFTPSENASYYTNFVTNATVNVLAYIFTGEGDDDDQANIWTKDDNWNVGNTPTIENVVIIRHNVIIEDEVSAYSVEIEDGYTLTIAPTGGLSIGAGGISGATIDNFVIKASTAGQNGYVRVSPEFDGEMPNATVEYYCTSYYDQTKSGDNAATYQCVGAPITASGVRARDVYPAGTYVYTWNEATEGWVASRAKLTFKPFQGFETSQKLNAEGWKAEYEGQLVSGKELVTLDLDYTEGKGYNLLANSFAAPIAIENFDDDDFVNVDQTIYILNAGTRGDSKANAGDYDAPGKWVGVPIKTASELVADGYPCLIPTMQGFWIHATDESPKLKLDYSRLVWGVNYSGIRANKPLRSPKRTNNNEESPVTGRLKINISTETDNDFVYLLESERYSANYENGYDARKISSGSVDVFTVADGEELGVDATNSIIGTRVGVRTGEETAYTLEFSHLTSENGLALYDRETEQTIDINEGTQYTFFAESNAMITERFEIVARADAPAITTGVDNVENGAKVHKFIKDNQLFILKNGVLYNATGAVVR